MALPSESRKGYSSSVSSFQLEWKHVPFRFSIAGYYNLASDYKRDY